MNMCNILYHWPKTIFISYKNSEDGIHNAFIEWKNDLELLVICVIQKTVKQYKTILEKVIVAQEIDETIFGELDFLKEDIPIVKKVSKMCIDQLVLVGLSHRKCWNSLE